MRRLLEEATGKETGSVYDDRIMPRSENGIVIKTHKRDLFNYNGAIHLLRHPMDSIVSYYHFRKNIEKKKVNWEDHIVQAAKSWELHTKHWLNAPYPVKQVRFEDMKRDTAGVLDQVLSYLNQEVRKKEISDAVKESSLSRAQEKSQNKDVASKFYRKGNTGDERDRFSCDEKKLVLNIVRPTLQRIGYSE